MRRFLVIVAIFLLAGCATSPTGRTQLKFFPHSQMAQMGDTAYGKLKKETPVSKDSSVNQYVQCVAHAITKVVPQSDNTPKKWDVTVFKKDEVNAFALPGGNIGVYTGLLKVADGQAQLAAVLGHEVGHVLAGHANERLSMVYATNTGLQLVQALSGKNSALNGDSVMALLGLGAQVGILLPFSRAQESEADLIGLKLMAGAGFDPHASVDLWHNMEQAGGKQPPEFLSTHPSHETRIDDLKQHMDEAMKLYRQAKADGRSPDCR